MACVFRAPLQARDIERTENSTVTQESEEKRRRRSDRNGMGR
jgi:hypothetical protein